jgi:Zn-dependent protease
MGRDIPLGRIAGIKVGMDLSVVVIALINTVLLASNQLPAQSPGHADTAYWLAGAAGAILFFVSLLVHEMGHALVARDEGIGVQGITLWLLGGVTKLASAPTTSRSEFRIAVVGPLASAACGVAFLAGSYTLPDTGTPALVGALFAYLGLLNLLLAIFNILPAAPLDGGTVLSAGIWRATGSQAKGMAWAARSGVLVGGVLVLWGIQQIRGGGSNGLFAAVVGGFILLNALKALKAAPLYQLLDGATVALAMEPAPPTAAGWTSVADFLRALPRTTTHQSYPVVGEHGRVVGLLTANAVRAVPPDRWESLRVSDLAFPLDRITVLTPGEPLLPAVQKIDGGDVREGLVVDADGSILGTLDSAALYTAIERRRAEVVAAGGDPGPVWPG